MTTWLLIGNSGYEIAAGIYKQADLVRVSTLLSVIGEDAIKAFDTFVWSEGQKEDSIKDVLTKFDEYCKPCTQVIYERYRFNNRKQEAGESISAYVTELCVIAKNCAHDEMQSHRAEQLAIKDNC